MQHMVFLTSQIPANMHPSILSDATYLDSAFNFKLHEKTHKKVLGHIPKPPLAVSITDVSCKFVGIWVGCY